MLLGHSNQDGRNHALRISQSAKPISRIPPTIGTQIAAPPVVGIPSSPPPVEATVTNIGGVDANIAHLLFRVDPQLEGGYDLYLAERDQFLGIGPPERWLDDKPFSVQAGQSYRLRVEVYDNTATVIVDGSPEFQFSMVGAPTGQIGLGVTESQASFDDVVVTAVGPPPAVPRLSFTVQPSNAEPGVAISPAWRVE